MVYCLAEIGTPPITYQWLRNNEPIDHQEGLKVTIEPITSAFGLVIQSVSVQFSGNYTCIARNMFGEDKFSAPLIVKGKYLDCQYYSDSFY